MVNPDSDTPELYSLGNRAGNVVTPGGTRGRVKETGKHLRITNGVLAREAISRLHAQMRGLAEANRRVSTGLRVSRPSDDPLAAAGIMRSSSGLRALEQYQRNLQSGQSRLNMEDSVLEQISNVLSRAKELAVSQAGDSTSAASRLTVRAEVDGIIDFVTGLANRRLVRLELEGNHVIRSEQLLAEFDVRLRDIAMGPDGKFYLLTDTGDGRLLRIDPQDAD